LQKLYNHVLKYNYKKKNCIDLNKPNDKLSGKFKIHPCNSCKYRGNLNYKFVFDIGIGHKGNYTAAIEILNKSTVKDEKLLYCIKNNINLFEIKAETILKEIENPKYIKCQRLWWKDENGNINVADQYSHLLKYVSW